MLLVVTGKNRKFPLPERDRSEAAQGIATQVGTPPHLSVLAQLVLPTLAGWGVTPYLMERSTLTLAPFTIYS